MTTDELKQQLLEIMETKVHWAWPSFTSGAVDRARLHHHLEQEYAVYVRDFAVLVGRAYVQCPIADVRRDLAANIYEEETGRLSFGVPHAELFLRYPGGLGMDLERFAKVELAPAARKYRAYIDHATSNEGWEVATAITTLWLEGTSHERGEVEEGAPRRPEPPLEAHPLVVHYGLPLEDLALTRAHRMVEGGHRASAWRVLLGHVGRDAGPRVVSAMRRAAELWQAYRDEVAAACGVSRAA